MSFMLHFFGLGKSYLQERKYEIPRLERNATCFVYMQWALYEICERPLRIKMYTMPQPKPAYSYEKCCAFMSLQTQLDIQIEVFYLPNHTQPPCSSNSETRDAVCLPHFPTCNYDFRLHGDVISHWETRKFDFPSPKKFSISISQDHSLHKF